MGMLLALTGEKANTLEDAIVSSSPAAHAVDGLTALYDGRPSLPFRFGSTPTNGYVQWDGNRSTNGGFEISTLSGWIDDSDTASGFLTSEEATLVNSGTKALKMTTAAVAAKKASRYWDIPNVRAGHKWNWTCALRGDGTRTARFRILCLQTGKYWNGSGWQVAAFDLATRTLASYATTSGVLVVESFSAIRTPLVTLRLIAIATDNGAGAAYADDIYAWPSWDFVSVHGHRYLDPVITCSLVSGTDGSTFGTTRANPTIYQPSFYSSFSPSCDERYGRLLFTGTALAGITIGELVVGQALQIAQPLFPIEVTEIDPDLYSETSTGDASVSMLTYHNRRAVATHFEFGGGHTIMEQARDEFFRRSRARKTPMVIVPDNARPEVYLARTTREWRVLRKFLQFYGDNDLTLAELPFFP